jgi:ABC-type branched-subunit amino acid transport system substrate-binding protein
VLLAAALSTSACGNTEASGGSSTSDEIRVMAVGLISPTTAFGGISFPYGVNGVKAAAAAINADGGIDGRLIKVDTCDTKGDPNLSAQCGRTAIKNGDVAVLGTFDPLGAPQLLTVLEASNVPYIGGLPTSIAEFTSPVSFQFDPGPILSSGAIVQLWKDSGCTQVVSILPANPGNDQIAEQQAVTAEAAGLGITTSLIKPGTTDVTPALSTALSTEPDCFTYGGDGQTNVKFILGLEKLGYTGKIITSSGSLTPQFLEPLGAAGDGIIVLNSTLQPNSDDPMVQQFMTDLGSYLDGDQKELVVNANEFSQDGWSSVQLLKQAMEKAGAYDSAALMRTIPTMCDVNVGNVYPHINFCEPVAESTVMPRVYNNQWRYFTVQGGQYVESDDEWHNSDTVPGSS